MQVAGFFLLATISFANLLLAKYVNSESSSSGVVVCYYGTGANERNSSGRFGVSDIPLDLCTHVVYSFLGLTPTGELTYPTQQSLDGKSNSISDFVALKESSSTVKLLVSIGGWNEASTNFSTIVNNDTLRATLVNNLVTFIETNNLDGIDLDWEYPAQRGGVDSDKEQFVVLVKELKEAFTSNGRSYLLTAAVAVTQSHIDLSYNVTALNEYLDYINLMTYDLHGSWDSVTGVNAPLYAQLTDSADTNLNVNNSVNVWISNGASPGKIVLGMPAYGKTFTLSSTNDTDTGAPTTGAGVAGPYVAEAGNWAYYEICEDQEQNAADWSITEVTGNYVYANKDTFWVGYDNNNTVYAKGQYAKSKGLAGVMFWAVDLDDFNGLCGDTFPLISSAIAGYSSGLL